MFSFNFSHIVILVHSNKVQQENAFLNSVVKNLKFKETIWHNSLLGNRSNILINITAHNLLKYNKSPKMICQKETNLTHNKMKL